MDLHGRTRITILALIAALLATACSHRIKRVERAMVLPDGAARHEMDAGQRFLMAVPIEDPDPVYPGDSAFKGTLRVCASFVVTADGAVADPAFDRDGPFCVDPAGATYFTAAVGEALRQWRYFAAAICTFPEGRDPATDPDCTGPDVRVDPVPIRLRYVFTFSSERGGRVSRAQASPSAH